jgi:hypothetical protein
MKRQFQQVEARLLDLYIEIAPPVSWIRWFTQLRPGKARLRLSRILFDPRSCLRDLLTGAAFIGHLPPDSV